MFNRHIILSALYITISGGGVTHALAADDVNRYEAPEGYLSSPDAFWTNQEIKEAKPIEFYDEERDPDALPSHLYGGDEELGPPGSMPGGTTEGTTEGTTVDFLGTDFGTVDEFDSFHANKHRWSYTVYPWKAIGKLLITTQTGGQGSCSASVIGRGDALVTAAHCCYDRRLGDWNKSFTFIPGLHASNQPYGQWPVIQGFVLQAWADVGGRQNDVCVLKTTAGLASRTGWLGRSWNKFSTEHVHTIGYPGNIGNAVTQQFCVSENYKNCGSSIVNATGCNKTYGDSGAPWIRTYKPKETGAKNFVNSVTSGWDSCTGTFGKSYNGPKFTSNNIVPLCDALPCE